jgi:hypothetical protein
VIRNVDAVELRTLSLQSHASRISIVIVAVPRQSYKKFSAFGARHQREGFSAGYAPRQNPATIAENANFLVLLTRQTRHDSEKIDRLRR